MLATMAIYLLLVLYSSFFHRYTNAQVENSALCFLVDVPASETIEFAEELARDAVEYNVEVFIMIDNNAFTVSNISTSPNLRLLQISNEKCVEYGYQKAISLYDGWRDVTSWDKALFYFALLNKNYSFVWLIENDVLIPNVQAFRSLHQLYSNTSDLIVPNHILNVFANTSTWHWHMVIDRFIPPWASSMVNVVGLSRRMLEAINEYVQWIGEVPFHEFFFNTLAMHLNYTIVVPMELSTIVFDDEYSASQINKDVSNLWHPFKNVDMQKEMHFRFRSVNQNVSTSNMTELLKIETFCHSNQTTGTALKQLQISLDRFKRNKSQFSSYHRRLLHEHFSRILERCHKHKVHKHILSLIAHFVHHTYQHPQRPMVRLVASKSALHLKLEQTLKKVKEAIFSSPRNHPALYGLRKQTAGLISQLTVEIQRECQEQKDRNHSKSSLRMLSTSSCFVPSTIVKMSRTLFQSTRQNEYQLPKTIEDYISTPLLILIICMILCIFLRYRKGRDQKYFIIILIGSLLCYAVSSQYNISMQNKTLY